MCQRRDAATAIERSLIEIKLDQQFPAGIDRLWAAFGRAEYPSRKYLALGAAAVRMSRFSVSAQAIDVELERDVTVDPRQLPPWVRWSIGRVQTLRHRSAWRRAGPTRATAELHIAPLGLSVQAHAAGTITETPAGTSRLMLTWRVSSDLPLVGPKVERLFADLIRTSSDADHAFTLRYLQAHGS